MFRKLPDSATDVVVEVEGRQVKVPRNASAATARSTAPLSNAVRSNGSRPIWAVGQWVHTPM